MRAVHICKQFNLLSETFVYDIVTGLEQAGIENHVIAARRVNAVARPFPRVVLVSVPPWDQAAFILRKRLMGLYRFPLPERATLRALTSIRPDVIVAHFGGAASVGTPSPASTPSSRTTGCTTPCPRHRAPGSDATSSTTSKPPSPAVPRHPMRTRAITVPDSTASAPWSGTRESPCAEPALTKPRPTAPSPSDTRTT